MEEIISNSNDTKKKKKAIAIISISLFLVVLLGVGLYFLISNNKYNSAVRLYNDGKYEEAIDSFSKLIENEYSKNKKNEMIYLRANSYLKIEDYQNAFSDFKSVTDYKDSQEFLNGFHYLLKSRDENSGKTTINYKYDSNGNCIEAEELLYGDEYAKTYYEYDENNNRVYAVEDDYEEHYWYYNEQNQCINGIHTISFAGDKTTNYYYFAYDSNGNLIHKNYGDLDGHSETDYVYDENNNRIRETITDQFGNTDLICVFEYDENGNCIKENEVDKNGNKTPRASYEYDENGNCIKETVYMSDGSEKVTNFTYHLIYLPSREMQRFNPCMEYDYG